MVIESRHFLTIRKKLNALGYCQSFGEDSLPLVERLLDDLILTTHGLREVKRDPLRKSDVELTDQCENLKADNFVITNECANPNQKVADVTTTNNVNGNRHFEFRRETSDSDSSMPHGKKLTAGIDIDETNNLIDMLTRRCHESEVSIQLLQKEKKLTAKKTENLKKQIDLQDEEITRLLGLLENHKPLETHLEEPPRRDREQLIERMQSEMDELRTRNRELEQRMLLQLESVSRNAPTTASSSRVSSSRECSTQCDLRTTDGWLDSIQLSELLDNYEKTNNHFVNRTDQLVNSQKHLVLEIDRLKGLLPPSKRTTSAIKRNFARASIKSASSDLSIKSAVTSTTKPSVTDYAPPVREYIEGLLKDREVMRAQVESLHRSLRRWVESGIGNTGTSGDKNASMKDGNENAYTQTSAQVSPAAISEKNGLNPEANGDVDADPELVKQERNELQATLKKFEQSILEIQNEVILLRMERDQLLLKLEQSSNDLTDQRQYLKELETTRLQISELEHEGEQLRLDLDNVASQKNEIERVREQLQAALVQTRSHNSALVNELMMRKSMYNESVRAKQLSDSALSEAQHDIQVFSSRIKELESELRRVQEEVTRLHSLATQLDAEKDTIQATLDDRTEDVVELKAELSKANNLLEEKAKILRSLEQRLRQVTEMAADKDREVHLLSERLQELETSSQVVKQGRNISEQKYAKAQSDITVLAAEVESLKSRLRNASDAKIDLQSRLDEAMHGLSHSEQAMDMKLKEHKDLLAQYGSLSRNFEEVARRNAELERNFVDLEGALRCKEADLRDQLDRTQKAELEALNAKRERYGFEEKCARLSAAAKEAENRAHRLDGEVEEVRRDLAITRDLACALQSRLDSAAGHSVSVVAATKDLTAKLADCELKLRGALNETTHQRKLIVQLETLLAAAQENQLRLQEALDKKTEECENLRKSSDHTDPQITLKSIADFPNSEKRKLIPSVEAIRQASTTQKNLLFYNPVDPSVTATSSSSSSETSTSPSHQKTVQHELTRQNSCVTTQIARMNSSPGPNASAAKYYEPESVSDVFSTNQLSPSSSSLQAV